MLSFECDYNVGAHESILRRLLETNLEPQPGYGEDAYCRSAAEKIRAACECPAAEVRFLTGGTQTNQIIIDALLAKFEGVVAADTGHVSVHEAGAIEFTGHKVLTIPHREGKLEAGALEAYLKAFYADGNHDHMVQPGMVYISHPTEYGTLYTAQELEALHTVCRRYALPLFVDGARLGYGLAAAGTDVTLPVLARLCEVFYIGGTKVGALCGEAVVFPQGGAPRQFTTTVKQHGALLAKGRLLGLQFDALFTDGLYWALGKNAVDKADRLRAVLRRKGYELFMENPTNQVFVILDEERLAALGQQVRYSFWEALPDGRTVIRLATGWATTDAQLDKLEAVL